MSLAEHKKDGWTNQQPVAGAAAAAAYTGGQAEFTKALLASETAYAWQCSACGFHAFALHGDEASKLKRWRNARDLMCKHDRKCERGSSTAAAAAPEAAHTAAAAAQKKTRARMPVKRCEHGRDRSQCKDCGGSGICEHGRRRYVCKECGGKGICEHGRKRTQCKECGGGSICKHGQYRWACKDCGGNGKSKSICEHGRPRTTCKACGGGSICEHGRRRTKCKDCGGGSFCEHGRQRFQCKDCGGGGICEHGRLRGKCKDCRGPVTFLEATEVEVIDGEEPDELIPTVHARVIGSGGGKRKR